MPKRRQKRLKIRAAKDKKNDQIDDGVILEKRTDKDDEEIEKEKLLLTRVGVACLMIIFFIAWIFNLKYEFKASLNKRAKSGFNLSQAKNELSKAMDQVKQGLTEVKKIQEKLKPNALSGEPKLTLEQINLLKGKLLNEIATGTASSTKE